MKDTFHLLGLTSALSLAIALLLFAVTPRSIYADAAAQFYVSAIAVNSSFLVAVALGFSSLYKDIPRVSRRTWLTIFIFDLLVLFVGMMATALGLLNFVKLVPVESPWISGLEIYIYFSWVFGFLLFIAALILLARWEGQRPEDPSRPVGRD